MSRRNRRLAASILCLFLVALVPGTILGMLNGNFGPDPMGSISLLAAFSAFLTVGALVVARRPGNVVGWIFSAVGLLAATGVFSMEYAEHALVTRPGGLPFATAAAWYANWFWFPLIGLAMVFTLLFFPTGRLLSPRWRALAWLATLSLVLMTVLVALKPTLELQNEDFAIRNPIGVGAIGDVEENAVGSVLFVLFLISLVGAAVSLVVRFRRSGGEERQQLKWFTFAAALLPLNLVLDYVPGYERLGDAPFSLMIAFVPAAAGIAILRYRLYDIDIIVNRALVYGALTAVLGATYFGLVVMLQRALTPLTQESHLAVAASTLAVAALFRPARTRIQGFIDRRFYRQKYDAAKTLEAFSARLRDELDLDALTAELLSVVKEALQPAQVSLWVRTSAR